MSDTAMHPVEQVVTLVHDVGLAEGRPSQVRLPAGRRRPRPCGEVAHVVTLSYLAKVQSGEVQLVCNGCGKAVTLDDVSGDEPFTPEYTPPPGGI